MSKSTPSGAVGRAAAGAPLAAGPGGAGSDQVSPERLIGELINANTREAALGELSRYRESVPDLAISLWGTPSVVALLIQEVLNVYPLLAPPTISSQASTRVCNALALMQCIASHPATKGPFLEGMARGNGWGGRC